MDVYMFGLRFTRPTSAQAAALQRIAQTENALFSEANIEKGSAPWTNGGRYQGWFSMRSGPFQEQAAQRIKDLVADAGLSA